jgi:predicted glutamine amidotransferase
VCSPQPFQRDRWVFAHDGKIEDLDFLVSRCSTRRVRQIEGETESESFLAYLLSCLDVAGAVGGRCK